MKVLMVGNHESVHGGITSVIQQLLSHDWEKDGVKMYFLPSYRDLQIKVKPQFSEFTNNSQDKKWHDKKAASNLKKEAA